MLAEVNKLRASQPPSSSPDKPGEACRLAMDQYLHISPDIFDVKSGRYKGMQVPEALRCGIFQSNIAEAAGIISGREVTVRALEFGDLMKRKGYHPENFDPNKHYPDGTYIVGNGARDGTNSRHVALICNGQLIHTKEGKVVNEPISNKFSPGAYDKITVYIPPRSR